MDQTIINWILTCAGGVLGFLLNSIWQAVKDLQVADRTLAEKVFDIEILVAGDYLKKSEFAEMNKALFVKLDRIEDKLDQKADKLNGGH